MTTVPTSKKKSGASRAAIARVALLMAMAMLAGLSVCAHCEEQCALSIQAAIQPSMSISVTPDSLDWAGMRPGVNVLDNAVTVTMFSNVNYTAAISCDSPYLTDPSVGGASLEHPMEWRSRLGDFEALSLMPATVHLGGPDIDKTPNKLISFRQIVEYSDFPPNDPAARYAMTVRFNIEPRL